MYVMAEDLHLYALRGVFDTLREQLPRSETTLRGVGPLVVYDWCFQTLL